MLKALLLLLVASSAAGCVSNNNVIITGNGAAVALNNETIFAEIADSPDEWQKGLMYRESLAENGGMLFVFPEEAERSFWMKNTKIPLDAIFVSANLTVVNVRTMEPCYEDPCRSYGSSGPAKYVLEVNKGVAEKNRIAPKSKITIG